ncbi:molybdopterin molybdotransferase MoeA [Roseitranquillus sediminis]|uniref:molybdopterin molybdotransferase MoeA n=1 Tax=Roseitranquillus sediminis TaxID=2809051 RepID=UPI001D0C9DAB|nr:gephyrin-like molybdotransferase Glp [Roseitranquillus sediminis]MBM9594424.1 molybdopterin molybdotransferase MoeA [Roseitranquillus sediminis]
MISVAEALDRVLALVDRLDAEEVALSEAGGRVLAERVEARRDQPPFRASIMDGYAVRSQDVAPGARLQVVGDVAAGGAFAGTVAAGQAVRIFTGAPVPEGADRVVIQEDVRRDGTLIVLGETLDPGPYVRAAGADFRVGDVMEPRRLGPADIALLAAMNLARIPVVRRPVVALVATGDELVMPGEGPASSQIVSSNALGLAAMVRAAGGAPRVLPIARDNEASLRAVLSLAHDADLVVTIGGASVGEHDLVARVAASLGMERSFHKVAMRPGKPLMSGRLNGVPMIGLPGNPVSAMVCGQVFLLPALGAMLGRGRGPALRRNAPLAAPVAANGPREHYMRGRLGPRGLLPAESQDSALLSVLASSDCLIVRPPNDPARETGTVLEYLPITCVFDPNRERA